MLSSTAPGCRLALLASFGLLVACGGRQTTPDPPPDAPDTSVDEAETTAETTPAVAPSDIWFDEAHAAVGRGDCVGALVGLDEVIATAPWRADALLDRSVCHLVVGDPAGALEDARALIALTPDDPIAQYQLGASLVAAGAPGEADDVLVPLLDDPTMGRDVRLRVAEARLALLDADGADDVLQALDDDPDALTLRAVAAEVRQTVPEAVALYEAALSIDSDHLAALRNLGLLLLANDAPDEARALLERFLEHAPDDALDRPMIEGHLGLDATVAP